MGPKKRRSSTVAKASKVQKHPKKTVSEEVRDESAALSKTTSTSETQNTVSHVVSDKSKEATIMEKGHIFFFYKPKVELHEAHSLDDVQRLYMLLYPKRITKEDKGPFESHKRLIVLGKKQLPDVHLKGRPFWGLVEKVGTKIEEVSEKLNEEHYDTKTRGERTVEGARPCGEGVYAIIEHKGHTHLTYVLEFPEELGDVQKAFRIEKEGSFIISVRNPDTPSRAAFGFNKNPPEFPDELKQKFEGKKWCPVSPPTFLDYSGAEILIIPASDDLKDEYGKVGFQLEEDERIEVEHLNKEDIYKELLMDKKEHPAKPLFTGEWK